MESELTTSQQVNGTLITENHAFCKLERAPFSLTISTVSGELLGELKEVDGKLTFEGKVDDAAQAFFTSICKLFNK